MGNQRIIVTLLVLTAIMGIGLLGKGMTGMVAFSDTNIREICNSNNDCENPEVCCFFYEEAGGICHASDMCGRITELTQDEKENNIAAGYLTTLESNLDSGNRQMQTMSGVFILLLTFLFSRYFLVHKTIPKGRKRTSS